MKKIISAFLLFSAAMFFLSCSESAKETSQTDDIPYTDVDISETDSFDEPIENESEPIDDDPEENNLEDGPYGILFGDTAADFTLPLESGEWSFSRNRSSNENYIFIFYRSLNSESKAIWATNMVELFDTSPENTHYFFLVDGSKEIFDSKMAQLKDTIEFAMEISGGPEMRRRIHITTKPAREIDSWLNEWLKKYSSFFLGIDRFQKIRYSGSFHSWESSSSDPRFEFIYKEAELYNYEYELQQFLVENNNKITKINGLNGVKFPEEGWVKDLFFTVQLPAFSKSGKLFILLDQVCESQKSCEWDRLQQLFLCENEASDICDIEVGRWITTYGRSGKWLTDITPLIPLFEKTGKYKFKFTVAGDQYTNYLDFVYIEDEGSDKPVSTTPLFNGTKAFDETYNSNWEKISKEIPEGAQKVFISAYITGHGNGSEQANCAEFCKFESVFYVNDVPFEIDFDNAGTSRGCFDSVKAGVVPNQYGSWPFGRAGWCPGQDVKLINIDVTKNIKKGESNIFAYAAFLNGKNYTPVVTDSSGYRAEIPLSSFLIVY